MVGMRRSLLMVVSLLVTAPVALAGCGDDAGRAAEASGVASAVPSVSPKAVPVAGTPTENASLRLTPATGTKGLPVSTEIGFTLAGSKISTVALKDDQGKAVAGRLREDGSAWVPDKPLKNLRGYVATVTAIDAAGQSRTETTSFRTAAAGGQETGTGLYLFDDNTYGVAMPVVVEFNPGIKKKDRAGVQKRMFVQSAPMQPGAWSWTSSGTQAYYRPPKFWQPGTRLTVRIAVGGLPTGGGRHGDQDRSASVEIGRSLVMQVDNKTKQMTVVRDGKTVKTLPVSLGRKKYPSSSGTMVVMEKKRSTVFDTRDEFPAGEGYRVDIEYAQRLTWSGQYIHSAPWSAGDQGRRNVSHGCVNVSQANAKWLFDRTLIGDPITIRGTQDKLSYGNGWTPWDVSWAEFVKGSALPVPTELAQATQD
ncbi:Ig-like domain-containing protein [Actinoplanes sp. NPDC051859]|uniref:L,D-transpeptidase n=1 Tax=Actinoplanes sp. NPDC051859 TaxID=3363909 RepID=UPI00379420FD